MHAPIPLAPPLIEVEKVENVIPATKQGEYFELEPFQEEFAQPNSPHTRLLSLPHQTIEQYMPFTQEIAKRIERLRPDELSEFNDLFNTINNLKSSEQTKNTLMGLLFQLLDSKYEDTVAFRKVNDAYQFLIKREPDSSEYSISQALKLVTLCPYATIGGLDSTIPRHTQIVIPTMNDTLNEVANFLNPPVEPASEFFTSADNDLKSKILTSWLQAQTNQPSSMIKVRNLCSNILHLNGSSLSAPLTLQSYAKICEILYKNKDLEKTLDGDFQILKKL